MTQQEIQPDLWVLHQLEQTVQFFTAHNVPAYLVGGSLRNLLLGLPCVDWDIVTDQNAPQLARQLAHTLNGFYAPMHEKASRIVLKTAQQEMTIDVSPQHGESIERPAAEPLHVSPLRIAPPHSGQTPLTFPVRS